MTINMEWFREEHRKYNLEQSAKLLPTLTLKQFMRQPAMVELANAEKDQLTNAVAKFYKIVTPGTKSEKDKRAFSKQQNRLIANKTKEAKRRRDGARAARGG